MFRKIFEEPDQIEGTHSAFLPLFIISLSFILVMVYEVEALRYRTLVLSQQNKRVVETLQKAKPQDDLIEKLHQDLQTLAPTDPAAAAILKEFFPPPPPVALNQYLPSSPSSPTNSVSSPASP